MFWKFPPPEKYVALRLYINVIVITFRANYINLPWGEVVSGFQSKLHTDRRFFFGYIQIQDKQEAKGLFILNLDKINFKLLHEIKMCIQINML